MLPLAALGPFRDTGHHFQYDHVLGTSLDLVVWTPDAVAAERARDAVLDEIDRLAAILNTRDPESEISRLGHADGPIDSAELREIFRIYEDWRVRTGGIISLRPQGAGTPRNVDALGKAFIIDAAAKAAGLAVPANGGVLLNIGGDIVVRGQPREIAIADPDAPHENATPLGRVTLHNAANATSGTYARGAHLFDGRTGQPAALAASATVVARDAVTANALAAALCVCEAGEGFGLIARNPGAAALRVGRDGVRRRTAEFARLEQPSTIRVAAAAAWPPAYELDITLTLTSGGGRGGRGGFGGRRGGGRGRTERPYVAVWVENSSGALVKILAFWASKAKYFSELSSFWSLVGRNQNLLYSTSRATRDPGRYQLGWDGLDTSGKPAPPGSYRIVVETNQEHGVYAKQSGFILCGSTPTTLTLSATANFEPVTITFGPKPSRV
jgi:thiamine biosynthesis lipoprotein